MVLVFMAACKKQETVKQEMAQSPAEQSVSRRLASAVLPLSEDSTFDRTKGNASQPDSSPVPRLSGDFAFDLYRTVAAANPEKNIFLSPASARWALGMAYAGSSGRTLKEMAAVLGAGQVPVVQNMTAEFERMGSLLAADPKVQLRIANSLWLKNLFPFKKGFVSSVRRFYRAEVFVRNFVQADVAEANAWVSKKTEGKIPSIIERFNRDDRALVINAVYFKGNWTEQFKKEKTMEENFYLSSGKIVKCKMMDKSEYYKYFEGHGLQAVRLPYGNKRLGMIILLPGKSMTLTQLNNMLTPAFWKETIGKMKKCKGRVRVPRFKLEFEAPLNSPLITMGMNLAFDREKADFSEMADAPPDTANRLFITSVLQKTFVEVNEEGTEASAVTLTRTGSAPGYKPPPPFDFYADHPFLYAITDRLTGEMLFIGALYNPTMTE
jgi:serpin B